MRDAAGALVLLEDILLRRAANQRNVRRHLVHYKEPTWLKRGALLLVRGSARRIDMEMEELLQNRLCDISKLGVNVGRELCQKVHSSDTS